MTSATVSLAARRSDTIPRFELHCPRYIAHNVSTRTRPRQRGTSHMIARKVLILSHFGRAKALPRVAFAQEDATRRRCDPNVESFESASRPQPGRDQLMRFNELHRAWVQSRVRSPAGSLGRWDRGTHVQKSSGHRTALGARTLPAHRCAVRRSVRRTGVGRSAHTFEGTPRDLPLGNVRIRKACSGRFSRRMHLCCERRARTGTSPAPVAPAHMFHRPPGGLPGEIAANPLIGSSRRGIRRHPARPGAGIRHQFTRHGDIQRFRHILGHGGDGGSSPRLHVMKGQGCHAPPG